MVNESIQQNRKSRQTDIFHFLALQAEEEMKETGCVTVVCPRCGEKPIVNIEPHRLSVRCPCGLIWNGEVWT